MAEPSRLNSATPLLRRIWRILRAATSGWLDDRCPSMGAAIAYYAAFSLVPLLIIVIAIAGLFFGREAAQGAILAELGGLIGQETAKALQSLILGFRGTESGFLAAIIGILALIYAATGAVGEIQSALNIIWKAPPLEEGAVVAVIRRRLLSLALIAVMGFLLLTSLAVSAVLNAWNAWLTQVFPMLHILLWVLNPVMSLGVTTVLFAMIFKILPDTPIAWRDVWVGATVTALLFSIGKFAIGAYIGTSRMAASYGAAAAFIVVLLWVNYTAQILLFGAEIARAQAKRQER
ncbi:MAG TPA: YihY/virulence factor BrkB family protein [Hypericibacter adhaerens]|jgi:membrane protein|uniref:YihY/virulence factor BrkB family protein n=1 Tax=Hypericibacter adhaerens TaxID=2602016 RepID=UPI002C31B841|nr:YihY/virulence factor BrkB family protein [Hypericibacter adhaerens]HWA45443.1 YihY/virulence factor BrkB family protein [Hypericibacter adhaerens]